eukprot:4514379-Prymnesium_polylepis.1
MEGCPELEGDVVARHGYVHGVRTAILSHSVESVILGQPEMTEISISAQNQREVKVLRWPLPSQSRWVDVGTEGCCVV